jgi:hypothetical protein
VLLLALVAAALVVSQLGPVHPRGRLAPASADTSAAVTAGSAASRQIDPPGGGSRPNIVEVLADDMRVDDLQYAPHLMRIVARDGITMQNSFSSYPLCCPARASFFSGLLPHNHHVFSTKPPYGYRS